eukprot:1157539-Pelagomonas_calceolata.AAC.6
MAVPAQERKPTRFSGKPAFLCKYANSQIRSSHNVLTVLNAAGDACSNFDFSLDGPFKNEALRLQGVFNRGHKQHAQNTAC